VDSGLSKANNRSYQASDNPAEHAVEKRFRVSCGRSAVAPVSGRGSPAKPVRWAVPGKPPHPNGNLSMGT
jgi:hypothetical protein